MRGYCAKVDCGTPPSAEQCPAWDQQAIYAAAKGKQGSIVVDAATTSATSLTPGVVSISEVCRLGRQGPYATPKRCKVSLGGWSDWARIGSAEAAAKLAVLVGKLVLYTFADGVDLDFEHLSEFEPLSDEMTLFAAFIVALRTELDTVVKPAWVQAAKDRAALLQDMCVVHHAPTHIRLSTFVAVSSGSPFFSFFFGTHSERVQSSEENLRRVLLQGSTNCSHGKRRTPRTTPPTFGT
jgi:hypothetical protein